MLLSYAGKDASEAFEVAEHTEFAHEMMKQFFIGNFIEV